MFPGISHGRSVLRPTSAATRSPSSRASDLASVRRRSKYRGWRTKTRVLPLPPNRRWSRYQPRSGDPRPADARVRGRASAPGRVVQVETRRAAWVARLEWNATTTDRRPALGGTSTGSRAVCPRASPMPRTKRPRPSPRGDEVARQFLRRPRHSGRTEKRSPKVQRRRRTRTTSGREERCPPPAHQAETGRDLPGVDAENERAPDSGLQHRRLETIGRTDLQSGKQTPYESVASRRRNADIDVQPAHDAHPEIKAHAPIGEGATTTIPPPTRSRRLSSRPAPAGFTSTIVPVEDNLFVGGDAGLFGALARPPTTAPTDVQLALEENGRCSPGTPASTPARIHPGQEIRRAAQDLPAGTARQTRAPVQPRAASARSRSALTRRRLPARQGLELGGKGGAPRSAAGHGPLPGSRRQRRSPPAPVKPCVDARGA